MTIVHQPYTINPSSGDLLINGREGLYLEVAFLQSDGTPRDVSAAQLFFEVEATLRVALAAGSSNDKRVIQLTRAQVALFAGKRQRFALIDESGTIPDVIWQGVVQTNGFTEQPA